MRTRQQKQLVTPEDKHVAQFEEFLSNLVTLKEFDNELFEQPVLVEKVTGKGAKTTRKEHGSPRRSARLVKQQDSFVPDIKDLDESDLEADKAVEKPSKKRKMSVDSLQSKKSRLSDAIVPTIKKKKRCSYCNTTATPMWRHGPEHCPVLCNSCGVKFKRGRILSDEEMVSIPSPAPTEIESPIEEKLFEIQEVHVPDVEPKELEKSFHEIFETSSVTDTLVQEDSIYSIEHSGTKKETIKTYPCARLIPMKEMESMKEPKYFVSELSKPLPIKVPSILSHGDTSSYYPAPENLTLPDDRYLYLSEKMTSISPEKLAQLLCILDPKTKNDLLFAIRFRKDVHFDVTTLSNADWIQVCELFGH
jgi:hypothetical protein